MIQKPIETIETAAEARDIAIEWQHWQSEQNLSWLETSQWGEYFEQIASKFPELKDELSENGIISFSTN